MHRRTIYPVVPEMTLNYYKGLPKSHQTLMNNAPYHKHTPDCFDDHRLSALSSWQRFCSNCAVVLFVKTLASLWQSHVPHVCTVLLCLMIHTLVLVTMPTSYHIHVHTYTRTHDTHICTVHTHNNTLDSN